MYVAPAGVSPLLASRVIALDKWPGVRPIAVGEVLRRIMGKAVMSVVGDDVRQAAGPYLLCAGQQAGCEAAVHGLRQIFEDSQTEAVLLVDATNAFNCLNRQVALRNVLKLCPSIGTVLVNMYRMNADLYINGTSLLSQEGTMQGDPLAMAFYALATVPLSSSCKIDRLTGEIWFADDAAGGGNLFALREWWDELLLKGPMYGYFPNGEKTWLVVKEKCLEQAKGIFAGTSVRITCEGRKDLGAPLGTPAFIETFVKEKVTGWCTQLETLAKIAISHPHEAYAAYTHGLRGCWSYFIRTVPDVAPLFQPLENIIATKFIPALTGLAAPGKLVRSLLGLPARLGGLGVVDPTTLTNEYNFSMEVTAPLVAMFATAQPTRSAQSCAEQQRRIKTKLQSAKHAAQRDAAQELYNSLPPDLQRCMTIAQERGASNWLTALPLAEHGFDLHKGAFRDALRIRYGWNLDRTPSHCVCGAPFSIDHAMICASGGYPTLRHNEVRDLTANILRQVVSDVEVEPRFQPLSGEVLPRSANVEDDARADIRAQGFWGCDRQAAFFDVRVFHPNAASYRSVPIAKLYKRHEDMKKRDYGPRVREIERGCFSPLVFTTSGGMGREATVVYKRLADRLSARRDSSYAQTMGWLRCRLSFALLRSALLCIRGSRTLRARADVSDSIELTMAQTRVDSY